jgi:hypothetical protein
VGYLLLATACDRQPETRANDTAAVTPPPPDSAVTVVVPVTPSAWDSAGGPVFLVMSATGTVASVVVPAVDSSAELDTLRLTPGPEQRLVFDVFQLGRRIGSVRVSSQLAGDIPADCSAWPAVRLAGIPDSTAWSVAFAEGRFESASVDSIAAMSAADSSRLARDIARLASSAPGDTSEALRGIPFVVRRAYLLGTDPTRNTLLAEVIRSLNQEASPVHEQMLLMAERDSVTTSRWELAYSSRMVGGEEALESVELLTSGRWKNQQVPIVLVARYTGDGVIYGLLTRQNTGRWKMTWTSPYAGC